MRTKNRSPHHQLAVSAVAGAHTVHLCFDLPQIEAAGLLGFAVHRTDRTQPAYPEAGWLEGMKCFAETDPQLARPARYSTREHPIQDFFWADYRAKPDHVYEYRVLALKGTPSQLEVFDEVTVEVRTESVSRGVHRVSFNRGAASSQEYARRFGNQAPDETHDISDPKLRWLSRGNFEAIEAFIGRATDQTFGLRVAAYEFHYEPVLRLLKAARDRGADVQVVYDAKDNGHAATEAERAKEAFPKGVNERAIDAAGLAEVCTPRTAGKSYIAHNKFMVLLRDGAPVSVLTGSTNFSAGGIFGQANVVHVIDDAALAGDFATYWRALAGDPARTQLRGELSQRPLPGPTQGLAAIFSPRSKRDALALYAELAANAHDALFMTFAFGMDKAFLQAYDGGQAPLRYALMEKLVGPGVKTAQVPAAQAEMLRLRRQVANVFAVGSTLPLNALDNWVEERLTELNHHVRFVHTKFMLVDPLGEDPVVVTGSANFSGASSDQNDENMVVIRGDEAVADVYLGEYMRLWEHYAFREYMQAKAGQVHPPAVSSGSRPGTLDPDDGWTRRHFQDSADRRKRAYFISI